MRGVKNIIVHPKYWGKTVQGVLIQPPDYDVGESKPCDRGKNPHQEMIVINIIRVQAG